MSPREKDKEGVTEEKLGHAMVKARLLTDNQLKAAFDYHRSLGGSLLEVVTKLGFVQPPALTRFLTELNSHIPSPTGMKSTAIRAEKSPKPLPEALPGPGGMGTEEVVVLSDTSTLPERYASEPSLLEALIDLLVRKGVIEREELERSR
jgi:hypothetical protein